MRLDSTVVGMDFSDAAIEGALWASDCFAPGTRRLSCTSSTRPTDRLCPTFIARAGNGGAVAREYAETHCATLRLLKGGINRARSASGRPTSKSLQLARETGADLVVIGPHDNRPRTPGVSRHAQQSESSGHRPSPSSSRRIWWEATRINILVPVDDFSITPRSSPGRACLAETFDAHVTLLHVWSNAAYSHVASMAYATAPR